MKGLFKRSFLFIKIKKEEGGLMEYRMLSEIPYLDLLTEYNLAFEVTGVLWETMDSFYRIFCTDSIIETTICVHKGCLSQQQLFDLVGTKQVAAGYIANKVYSSEDDDFGDIPADRLFLSFDIKAFDWQHKNKQEKGVF